MTAVARPATATGPPTLEDLRRKVEARRSRADLPLAIEDPSGASISFADHSTFRVVARDDDGMRALGSMSELTVAESYIAGHLDFEGDLVEAMRYRKWLHDWHPLTAAWGHIHPLLVGRQQTNPAWIAQHYDSNNVQLFALDEEYGVYTPGIYESEQDTLEQGAARKLRVAADALELRPGAELLDIGCGWGGFIRYNAARGVSAHGITLSRHQLQHTLTKLDEAGLRADVRYQDVFTYEPSVRFDGISMMGVLEDISDYEFIFRRIAPWLAPGGRVYCDFAAARRRWGVPSFVTKYVWPGKFRMVHLPTFTRAVARAGFDIVELHNDRQNYYLWTKAVHARWLERCDEVIAASNEQVWRMMRLLFAGTAEVMSPETGRDTAYRIVLERRPQLARPWFDRLRRSPA